MTDMNREQILDEWLTKLYKGSPYQRTLLTGDASFRKYYRIYGENSFETRNSLIVMDAPLPENPAIFAEIASLLNRNGFSVPKVFASNLDLGFLLLSDLGDRIYLKELNEMTSAPLYEDALKALVSLQDQNAAVPSFDQAFLERQWKIFTEWFLGSHLELEITPDIDKALQRSLDVLNQVIEEQPFVFVHRDYHSRNLMILEQGNPGILDFQDAMNGPITYDLVSLLQDCYISWPRKKVIHWIEQFRNYAMEGKQKDKQNDKQSENEIQTKNQNKNKYQMNYYGKSLDQFLRWFDLTGVQRHLKNLGIFSRLHYRDGKSHYLNDLAMPFKYVQEACERYEELSDLKALMKLFEVKMQHRTKNSRENLVFSQDDNQCAP